MGFLDGLLDILVAFCVVVLPLLWMLGAHMGKSLTGMRLESHRLQMQRWLRMVAPVWLLAVVSSGRQLMDRYPVSREHHAFWLGFITASELFLVAMKTRRSKLRGI